jgi:hypothetical protein
MTRPLALALALGLLGMACSSSDEEKEQKQKECDAIAAEIRTAATARGMPTQGACNAGVADFATACAKLQECNEEVNRM